MTTKNTRVGILHDAASIVSSDRESDYGSPEDSFTRIATLWSAYLDVQISSIDVAAMMALLKIARLKVTPTSRDGWVDLAGYAACGGEIALGNGIISPTPFKRPPVPVTEEQGE